MFTLKVLIGNHFLPQRRTDAERAVRLASSIDQMGCITLLVLGILAATGYGTDSINHLNSISGINCGGGLMIGGSILTSMISGWAYRRLMNTLNSSYENLQDFAELFD